MRSVVRDKIHAVQRELYLHSDYEDLLTDLYKRLEKFDCYYDKLPLNVLESFYLDDNCDVQLSFSSYNSYA
jgi:hypothetical protein